MPVNGTALVLPGGMLSVSILLFIASLLVYALGAGRVAGFTMDAAKILVTVFLVLATLAFIGRLTS